MCDLYYVISTAGAPDVRDRRAGGSPRSDVAGDVVSTIICCTWHLSCFRLMFNQQMARTTRVQHSPLLHATGTVRRSTAVQTPADCKRSMPRAGTESRIDATCSAFTLIDAKYCPLTLVDHPEVPSRVGNRQLLRLPRVIAVC